MPLLRPCCTILPAILAIPALLYAQPTTAAPEVATMQQVENTWDMAIDKHDQFALENLLATDFVGIAADGEVTTRNQQIAHLFVSGAEPVSLTQKVVSARLLGDLAIVNGTYVMEWKGTTEKVAEKGIFTHIFRRSSANGWQCINSQRTVVTTEDERKKAAATPRAKSNAALPLHIPLVYHGPKSTQPAPQPGANAQQP